MRIVRVIAAVCLLAAGLTACASSSGNPGPGPNTTRVTTTVASPAPTSELIRQLIIDDQEFNNSGMRSNPRNDEKIVISCKVAAEDYNGNYKQVPAATLEQYKLPDASLQIGECG